MELLLVCGAEVEASDEEGWTALMYAADTGHAQAVQLLRRAGAQQEVSDAEGRTAVDLAVGGEHLAALHAFVNEDEEDPQE
eukprot:1195408-Prorocentrum_minimum.AAC.1